MSCNYELTCLDCAGARTGMSLNHGGEALAVLLKNSAGAEALLVLIDIPEIWPLTVALDLGSFGEAIRFIGRHKGHRVMVIDQYGRLWDRCGKDIDCPCGARSYCARPEGHRDACSKRETAT